MPKPSTPQPEKPEETKPSAFVYKIPEDNHLPAASKATIEAGVNAAIAEFDQLFGSDPIALEVGQWFARHKGTATYKHLGTAWVAYLKWRAGAK